MTSKMKHAGGRPKSASGDAVVNLLTRGQALTAPEAELAGHAALASTVARLKASGVAVLSRKVALEVVRQRLGVIAAPLVALDGLSLTEYYLEVTKQPLVWQRDGRGSGKAEVLDGWFAVTKQRGGVFTVSRMVKGLPGRNLQVTAIGGFVRSFAAGKKLAEAAWAKEL